MYVLHHLLTLLSVILFLGDICSGEWTNDLFYTDIAYSAKDCIFNHHEYSTENIKKAYNYIKEKQSWLLTKDWACDVVTSTVNLTNEIAINYAEETFYLMPQTGYGGILIFCPSLKKLTLKYRFNVLFDKVFAPQLESIQCDVLPHLFTSELYICNTELFERLKNNTDVDKCNFNAVSLMDQQMNVIERIKYVRNVYLPCGLNECIIHPTYKPQEKKCTIQ